MTRLTVINYAASRLGNYGKGSDEVYGIWRRVLPPAWSDAQVRQYAKTREWCGGFALDCLREGGLTDAHWQDGIGFLGPVKLPRVPWPKPGDIAVKEHPFSHHMVVEWWNNDNDWGDIAGNTPFVARHRHGSSVGIHFYSIASLLGEHDTDPAPPPRPPTLRIGSTGADVRTLQAKLNSHGAQLKVDGAFGPATALAVQNFQRRSGVDPDGIVGAITWGLLEQV